MSSVKDEGNFEEVDILPSLPSLLTPSGQREANTSLESSQLKMQVRKQVYDHPGFGARLVCLTPLLAAPERGNSRGRAYRCFPCPQPPSVWSHHPCLLE